MAQTRALPWAVGLAVAGLFAWTAAAPAQSTKTQRGGSTSAPSGGGGGAAPAQPGNGGGGGGGGGGGRGGGPPGGFFGFGFGGPGSQPTRLVQDPAVQEEL